MAVCKCHMTLNIQNKVHKRQVLGTFLRCSCTVWLLRHDLSWCFVTFNKSLCFILVFVKHVSLLWFLWVKQQILLNTVWNYIIYSTLVIDLVISHSILSNMHIMAVPSSYLVTEMSSLDLYHLYIINSIVRPSWGTSQTLISDNCGFSYWPPL